MSLSSRTRLHALVAGLAVLAAGFSGALAFKLPETPGRFGGKVVPDPSVAVSPMILDVHETALSKSVGAAWDSFKLANGGAWDVYVDVRSGAPTLVRGQGVPLIPGAGNTLAASAPVTLDTVVALVRGFAARNSGLLAAADKELVLNEAASGQVAPELWQVVFDHVVSGVPVAGDRYDFYISHGNLVSFGAARWTNVTTDPTPTIPANEAFGILANDLSLTSDEAIDLIDDGSLTFLPMTAAGSTADSFEGAVGTGYRTALAWRVALRVSGEAATWVGFVDAHSGAVLAMNDETQYAQSRGGILPLTDDGISPDGVEKANYPMPFTNLTVGTTNSAASSMGYFACTPGGSTATTTLQGTYIRVADVCGSISKSVTCDADLNMGASAGTDCTTPGSGGAGNTHAARSSFYHLNRIKEHARSWLPANTWLQGQMTDNVNINNTCNAFWDDGGATGTVNFYRSGGGCRNTGEIASVFLHEWGHGLDQNDGGGYDNPSEAYADVSSFLLTHKSCIGRGFTSSNCGGYGNACTSCTGVRDQDYAKHSTGNPQTPDNFSQMGSCPSGSGPCSKEVHCESYISGEALWDLAVRDLPAAGYDQQTSWELVDKLWYVSRTGSGGNAYSCGSPASSRSCATTNWMQRLLTADDDDGNLANGTPHAAAIFAAFNRHAIQCGASTDAANQSTTVCPTLTAPTLTATGALNSISLSWTTVPNATSYNVLRNDQGCDWGHTVIANVAGTSYTDSNLPNNFPLYYSVQAIGSNSACTGPLATCATVQAVGPCTYDPTFGGVTTVANPSSSTCTLNLAWTAGSSNCGGSLTYNVYRSTTSGFTPGPSNRIATGLTGTSYVDTSNLVSGTTYYYVVRAVDTSNSVEETNTVQMSNAPSGALSGLIDTFEGSQSGGGFDLAGWTHSAISGSTNWAWSTAQKYDGTHSWFAQEITTTSDKVLVSPSFTDVAGTTLTFYHTYAFEGSTSACYDAGTLEYTINGGTTWTVVPDADFTAGGFNGTVYAGDTNPLKSKRAWCGGTIGALTRVAVNLGGDATLLNQTVQIRWHEGDDTGTTATGWYVDAVSIGTASACTTNGTCTAPGAPTLTAAAADCSAVNLRWTAGTGITSSYNVYRSTTAGGPYTKLNSSPVTTTSYKDSTAGSGATYYYVVRGACDSGGVTESVNSNERSAAGLANGATCNDGNACTQTDTCQSGACTGGNPVVCTALDQCHDVGTCNQATGVCTNPNKTNGTTCSDGNACTQTDTCQSGVCTGANPVVCTALDQCHNVGVCNTSTGHCSNPNKTNGTTCNDGNACTTGEACQSGVCTGGTAVAPPPEVDSTVTITLTAPSTAHINWTLPLRATSSDVLRGLASALPVGPGGGDETCLGAGVAGATLTDTDLPPVGNIFWYLVRGVSACGKGTYGMQDNPGGTPTERTSTTCP